MRRVLVTGGAGFIGSAVVRRLAHEAGTRVCTVDSLTYAGSLDAIAGCISGAHEFVRADIRDAAAMRGIFDRVRPTAVLHLAAESHVDRSIEAPADFLETNVQGTFVLLEAARRLWESSAPAERAEFRFVHVSTDEVFGALGGEGVFSTESRYQPTSPYAASKAAADHLVRAWHHTYGLPTLVTNCSNNYGPFQFPEKLIPVLILCGRAAEPMPVYGTGEQVRDWIYVEDHADALVTAACRGTPGETYLIGARGERRNLDVARLVADLLDDLAPASAAEPRRALITHVPDRPGHDLRYAIDPSAAERALGWSPRESFESGLRKTVAWYLENDAWTRRMLERVGGHRRRGRMAAV